MYPIDMTRPTKDHTRVSAGFAVANDAAEHEALSRQGYEPKYVPPEDKSKDQNLTKLRSAVDAVQTDSPDGPEADATESDTAGHTVATARAALDEKGIPYNKHMGLAKLLSLLPE